MSLPENVQLRQPQAPRVMCATPATRVSRVTRAHPALLQQPQRA